MQKSSLKQNKEIILRDSALLALRAFNRTYANMCADGFDTDSLNAAKFFAGWVSQYSPSSKYSKFCKVLYSLLRNGEKKLNAKSNELIGIAIKKLEISPKFLTKKKKNLNTPDNISRPKKEKRPAPLARATICILFSAAQVRKGLNDHC